GPGAAAVGGDRAVVGALAMGGHGSQGLSDAIRLRPRRRARNPGELPRGFPLVDPSPPGWPYGALPTRARRSAMTAILDPALLRRSEMFAGLADADLREVVGAGVQRRLARGQRIFAQGDPGVSCHTLVEGRVKIVQTRA